MEKSHAEKTPPVNRSNAEGDGKSPIQTKLTVGPSNDKFEKEADNTADRVVNDQTSSTAATSSISPLAQRQEDKDEEASAKLQYKEEEEESPTQGKIQKMEDEKEEGQSKLQRQEEDEAMTKPNTKANRGVTKKVDGKIKSSRGGGKQMSGETRRFMETRFGTDFGDVKIHNDANAHELSKELKAQAFTVGKDIYFASGKFDPNSKQGKHLLAHELTHTIQQSGGLQTKIQKKGPANSVYEAVNLPTTRNGQIQNDTSTVAFRVSDVENMKIRVSTSWEKNAIGFNLELYGFLHKTSSDPDGWVYPISKPIETKKGLFGQKDVIATLDPMTIAPHCKTDCDVKQSIYYLRIVKTTNNSQADKFTMVISEV